MDLRDRCPANGGSGLDAPGGNQLYVKRAFVVAVQVEPDQLWEEFFEFVEDVPSYDEIINYDVWQEFRDIKYPCQSAAETVAYSNALVQRHV